MTTFPNGPKDTWQHQAEQIIEGSIPTSAKDVPMLLEWLKDMNWPGAKTISLHIPSYGENIGPALLAVLQSGDTIWIRWVLAALSDSYNAEFWRPMKPAIQQIAYSNDTEGASAEALYILARWKLDLLSKIQTTVEVTKSFPGADPEDYLRVEFLLRTSKIP